MQRRKPISTGQRDAIHLRETLWSHPVVAEVLQPLGLAGGTELANIAVVLNERSQVC